NPAPAYGCQRLCSPGNAMMAASNLRRLFSLMVRRLVIDSFAAASVALLKNAWPTERYRPPCVRVISHSAPTIGAMVYAPAVSVSVTPPAFTPQNHASLNGRPCCAVASEGSATTAAAIVRTRRVRIQVLDKERTSVGLYVGRNGAPRVTRGIRGSNAIKVRG